jgi:intracellular sulfur oxidation DsrE/DsrF family protein
MNRRTLIGHIALITVSLLLRSRVNASATSESHPTQDPLPSSQNVKRQPVFITPRISGFGAIVSLPDSAEQPRVGSKVIFDITGGGLSGQNIKGLNSIARFVNLAAAAGISPDQLTLDAVLHGSATKAALRHSAYAKQTGVTHNPNLDIIRGLKDAGVSWYVCGQALAHHQHEIDDVLPEFTVAVAALTVIVNKQIDGYAYIPIS